MHKNKLLQSKGKIMIRCKKIAVILAVFSAMGMVVQGQGNGDNIAFSQGARTPLPALAPAAYEGHFWRVDAENNGGLPRNFRTCQSPFHKVEHKYASEVDSSYVPSRKGLDDLRISGSGQFSARQFDALVQALRKKTKGPIYDVDLRQESHGFFNGTAVSWYGRHDWGNIGKSPTAVLADEQQRLQAALGKDVIVYDQGKGDLPIHPRVIAVRRVQTEQELADSKGIHYVRLANTDHLWPTPGEIDAFLAFVRTLPDDAWLHFHCEAGAGRTTAYMVMYDMIKNPGLPYKDIVYRQYEIGGNYTPHDVAHPKRSDWKGPYYHEKHEMVSLFYQYVQDQVRQGGSQSWSQWLKNKRMRVNNS